MLDDQLEVRLHRLGLPLELASVGVREAGARLRLQLVGGEVLGLERQGLGEVAFEVGGALARDPVDEIERDVVKSGITKKVDGAPDVVRPGNTIQHVQKGPVEALCANRDTVDTVSAQKLGQLGRHRLGVRLDRHLIRVRQRREQTLERSRLGERRRAAAEEDRLESRRERAALERELGASAST